MGDHDQPYYPVAKSIDWFCYRCRTTFFYFDKMTGLKIIDEHLKLEDRLDRYVRLYNQSTRKEVSKSSEDRST